MSKLFDNHSREDGSLHSLEFDRLDFIPRRMFFVHQKRHTTRGNHFHDGNEKCTLFLINGAIQVVTHQPRGMADRNVYILKSVGSSIVIPGSLCRKIITHDEDSVWGVLVSSRYNPNSTYECTE